MIWCILACRQCMQTMHDISKSLRDKLMENMLFELLLTTILNTHIIYKYLCPPNLGPSDHKNGTQG